MIVSERKNRASFIANSIDASNNKIQLDSNIKAILSDKQILARILKYCLDEFAAMEIDEIISCIDGDISVGNISIEPGLTNSDFERIRGENLESNIQNEGICYFDIIFHTYEKTTKYKILIDLEAQKSSNANELGYHIENRMVFYLGRMISAQKYQEFVGQDYDNLKPVKSIWICMNSKDDAIVKFGFHQNMFYGKIQERKIDGVIIHVRNNEHLEDSKNCLIALLEDLLNFEDSQTKKKKLQEKHGIKMSKRFEGRIDRMCNLSDLAEERGFEKGYDRGYDEGRIEAISAMISINISLDKIKSLGYTEDEIENAMNLKK